MISESLSINGVRHVKNWLRIIQGVQKVFVHLTITVQNTQKHSNLNGFDYLL